MSPLLSRSFVCYVNCRFLFFESSFVSVLDVVVSEGYFSVLFDNGGVTGCLSLFSIICCCSYSLSIRECSWVGLLFFVIIDVDVPGGIYIGCLS